MRLLDGYNLTVGAVLAMAAEIFHQYGAVLATFLIFNIIDWITGTCKARFSGKESSVCGLKGICKKLGYWVLIFVAFMTGQKLMIMGDEMVVGFAAADHAGSQRGQEHYRKSGADGRQSALSPHQGSCHSAERT